MRHRQMKPRLEKRYHPSHADGTEDGVLTADGNLHENGGGHNNFDRQLLDKITNLKRARERDPNSNSYNNNDDDNFNG